LNIKVLIVTDNLEEWFNKVVESLAYNIAARKDKDVYLISCGLFYVEIRNSFPLNMRGACYSCCVMDKFLGHDIQDCILEPSVKAQFQYTNNYYKQWKELGNDYNKQDFEI